MSPRAQLSHGPTGTLGSGDRYPVVVHVDARARFFDADDGECAFDDGGARVSAETRKRIGRKRGSASGATRLEIDGWTASPS